MVAGGEGIRRSPQCLWVYPVPDDVSVNTPVLFVLDDKAGMTLQPEIAFQLIDRLFPLLGGQALETPRARSAQRGRVSPRR